jgi:hypothetical protein
MSCKRCVCATGAGSASRLAAAADVNAHIATTASLMVRYRRGRCQQRQDALLLPPLLLPPLLLARLPLCRRCADRQRERHISMQHCRHLSLISHGTKAAGTGCAAAAPPMSLIANTACTAAITTGSAAAAITIKQFVPALPPMTIAALAP